MLGWEFGNVVYRDRWDTVVIRQCLHAGIPRFAHWRSLVIALLLVVEASRLVSGDDSGIEVRTKVLRETSKVDRKVSGAGKATANTFDLECAALAAFRRIPTRAFGGNLEDKLAYSKKD